MACGLLTFVLMMMGAPRKTQLLVTLFASVCFAILGYLAAFSYGVRHVQHRLHSDQGAGTDALVTKSSSAIGSEPLFGHVVSMPGPGPQADTLPVVYVPDVIIAAPWPHRAATVSIRAPLAAAAPDLSRTESIP